MPMCSITPENVILFIGVTRRLHLFVGEYPTSISTSSVGRVVCESSPSIQLFSSCWIKIEVLHFQERCVPSLLKM